MNYIGEQCFACGKKFENGDDVVVCPECGTPYHRVCYKEAGECINHQLHESGRSWQQEQSEKNAAAESIVRICPYCHHKNNPDASTCSSCGASLNNTGSSQSEKEKPDIMSMFEEIDPNNQYLGFNPDEDFDGASLKEVTQFVDSNTFYYIPLFKRMKDFGSKISFNAICLLFPYFYFANRKMWLWALITAFASMLFNVPTMLYIIGDQVSLLPFTQDIAGFIDANENLLISLSEICNMAYWILRICTCLFGNWLYYRFTVRSVNKLKARYGEPVSSQHLKSKGGVQPINLLLIFLILIGLTMAAYFILTFVLMLLQQAGLL